MIKIKVIIYILNLYIELLYYNHSNTLIRFVRYHVTECQNAANRSKQENGRVHKAKEEIDMVFFTYVLFLISIVFRSIFKYLPKLLIFFQ